MQLGSRISAAVRVSMHSDGMQTHPHSKYRLAPDHAAQIRTAPPVNMTVMEAAAYLACSPRKLRDLIAAGRVKSARVGAKILLRREWLDSFLGA